MNVCMHQAHRYPGFAPRSESFHMGINLQQSQRQMASRDKSDALDEEDGGNGGEASC